MLVAFLCDLCRTLRLCVKKMPVNREAYLRITEELRPKNVTLVAVSKTKSVEDIKALYDLGQRDFAENYVQELVNKQSQLPADIRWHFIGHLQSNKVKNIASFIQLIQSVDSLKLLEEINKQGEKHHRVIDCLLQVHIAQEETKFGLNEKELAELFDQLTNQPINHVRVWWLMGMASFTSNMDKVRKEFQHLKKLFDRLPPDSYRDPDSSEGVLWDRLQTLSMGMSSDYKIAIEEGSTMVRIGSLLFGDRN